MVAPTTGRGSAARWCQLALPQCGWHDVDGSSSLVLVTCHLWWSLTSRAMLKGRRQQRQVFMGVRNLGHYGRPWQSVAWLSATRSPTHLLHGGWQGQLGAEVLSWVRDRCHARYQEEAQGQHELLQPCIMSHERPGFGTLQHPGQYQACSTATMAALVVAMSWLSLAIQQGLEVGWGLPHWAPTLCQAPCSDLDPPGWGTQWLAWGRQRRARPAKRSFSSHETFQFWGWLVWNIILWKFLS